MAWTRLCAITDLAGRDAAAFIVDGRDIVLIHIGGKYIAVSPVCRHVTQFLERGDRSECVEAGVPKCNRHVLEQRGSTVPGICDEPILTYPCHEAGGELYVDVERRELSAYERITCSPVLEQGDVAALQFNLWLDGERKISVFAKPVVVKG